MSLSFSGRWPALCCALVLSACGGGGGDSPSPPPPPPPPPPPVDTTPPDTTLTATPAAVSTSANGTFTASSSEAGSVFEASVDGGAYATVAATFTLNNLTQGAHSINVRARDAAGNTDATPATFNWTIDSLAPDTTLATLTPVVAGVSSASFTFTSEAGATFEVAVDGLAFAAATSPFQLAALTDGLHSVFVRARDAVGNVDPTPATFAWIVDTQVPDTAIVNSPAALSNTANGQFSFSSPEAGVTFQASLDGAAFAATQSPFAFNGISNGAHTFAVRAIDAAGNTDATPAAFGWTVDTQAPDTVIASSPAANSNSTSATFTFSSEANATFQVSVDGAAYAAASSPYQINGIASGAHTLNVRATDAAGNVDATPASFSWQVDTSQPSAQIIFPTSVSYTDASQLHVRGTASDTHTITGVTVNGVAATSTDAFAHWSALVPIAAGDNNLVVRVIDSFGNTNTNAAQALVANRGVVLAGLSGFALDTAHGRVLAADSELEAIVALRTSDGYADVFLGCGARHRAFGQFLRRRGRRREQSRHCPGRRRGVVGRSNHWKPHGHTDGSLHSGYDFFCRNHLQQSLHAPLFDLVWQPARRSGSFLGGSRQWRAHRHFRRHLSSGQRPLTRGPERHGLRYLARNAAPSDHRHLLRCGIRR